MLNGRVSPGDVIVIVGAGPIGLAAIALGRAGANSARADVRLAAAYLNCSLDDFASVLYEKVPPHRWHAA